LSVPAISLQNPSEDKRLPFQKPTKAEVVRMDFKKISEMFTFAIPILVLCSCIRLLTYYNRWDVPILDYLSPSEILLLFIQPILVITALGAIYFLVSLSLAAIGLLAVKMGMKDKKEPKPKAKTEEPPDSQKGKTPVLSQIIGVLGIVVIGAFFVEGIYDFEIIPSVLLHVFLLLAVFSTVYQQLLPTSKKDAWTKSLIAGITVVLISSSFFYGRFQAHAIDEHPIQMKIALKDAGAVESDSNHTYLGKTSNYYFFHDKATNQTVVIPVEEVKATYITSSRSNEPTPQKTSGK
jgi:hypothetical protein